MKNVGSICRVIFVVFVAVVAIAMLSSCSSSSQVGSGYQKHLRSTHHNNFIKHDNGGCGWSR
jgi:hypothetical protein